MVPINQSSLRINLAQMIRFWPLLKIIQRVCPFSLQVKVIGSRASEICKRNIKIERKLTIHFGWYKIAWLLSSYIKHKHGRKLVILIYWLSLLMVANMEFLWALFPRENDPTLYSWNTIESSSHVHASKRLGFNLWNMHPLLILTTICWWHAHT